MIAEKRIRCHVCGADNARIRECELRDMWSGQTRFHVDCGGHSQYRSVSAIEIRAALKVLSTDIRSEYG